MYILLYIYVDEDMNRPRNLKFNSKNIKKSQYIRTFLKSCIKI